MACLDIVFRRSYGTEFVSAAMDLWAYNNGVILEFRCRGKLTDNAHWFASLDDAQEKTDAFRWDYNEHHPHRVLEGLSPREYAQRAMTTAAASPS